MKTKSLKKIFYTSIILFFLLTIYTIPITKNNKVLKTNLELEDITSLSTTNLYLLNKDNYLVKTPIILEEKDELKKIKKIINYLKETNNKNELNGYIPKDTKINNLEIEDNIIKIDFSKEFLLNDLKKSITGIVYSLLEINSSYKVQLTTDNKIIDGYSKPLDKKIGINSEEYFLNKNNNDNVVIYYLSNNQDYYIPVTKKINKKNEKIEVIINELKQISPYDYISPLNKNTELLDYHEESNVLFLNFNKYLKDENKSFQEKTLNTIAYSVFDNYDVEMVSFEIENKNISIIKR